MSLLKIQNNIQFIRKLQYKMNSSILINLVKQSIPELSPNKHKGQAGRIGIVGGSIEYTGAPYFSGISALKVGADLVHIFCTTSAATVIKSYSPELIVHPLLDEKDSIQLIKPWLDRLHVLVIGPGLGRDPKIIEVVGELINITRDKNLPLVIDADGLFLVTEDLNIIKNYPKPGIILTPNKIEFERLSQKIQAETNDIDFNKLGNNVTIFKKGSSDEFLCSDKSLKWNSNIGGSNRRCGGQGDLLSGSIATFFNWSLSCQDNSFLNKQQDKNLLAASIACYAGSRLIRLCNEKAFKAKGRSMLSTDMVEYIHSSFEELYEG